MKQRVRAVIVKNGEVLLIKRVKPDEIYWVFPGGGVKEGESLETALHREIFEETGLLVNIGKLYWKRIFGLTEQEGEQEEFYFICDVAGGVLGTGDGPEFHEDGHKGTYEPQYVPVSKISTMNIKPETMIEKIQAYA